MRVPIALILGEDNKLDKIRIFTIDDTDGHQRVNVPTYSDVTYRAYRFIDYYSPGISTKKKFSAMDYWVYEIIEGCGVKTSGKTSRDFYMEIAGYNWLPVFDCHDNLIKDGVILAQCLGKLYAIDARCNCKEYMQERVLELAQKDVNHTIFCNLDYSNLTKFCITTNKLCLHERSEALDNTQSLLGLSGQGGVDIETMGTIYLSKQYFNCETALIPESWTRLNCNIEDCTVSTIALPKKMDYLKLDAVRCSNLKNILFPESGTGTVDKNYAVTWYLRIHECPNLENIVIPASFHGYMSIQIQNCANIKNIIIPASVLTEHISVVNCNNLELIEVANLRGSNRIGVTSCVNISCKRVRKIRLGTNPKNSHPLGISISAAYNLEEVVLKGFGYAKSQIVMLNTCTEISSVVCLDCSSNVEDYIHSNGERGIRIPNIKHISSRIE